MAKKHDCTEAALAKAVIAYLRDEQWVVYQEVSFQGWILDIVVTRDEPRLIGVVECKQAMGLPLLEQCHRTRPFANFVWAATWKPTDRGHGLVRKILGDEGFGWITVRRDAYEEVSLPAQPVFRRKLDAFGYATLWDSLRPQQMAGHAEAGTNRGKVWTPWRSTCVQLRELVERSPGISMKTAIDGVRHHYRSDAAARAAMLAWVKRGRVDGVSLKRDGRRVYLVPSQVTNGE